MRGAVDQLAIKERRNAALVRLLESLTCGGDECKRGPAGFHSVINVSGGNLFSNHWSTFISTVRRTSLRPCVTRRSNNWSLNRHRHQDATNKVVQCFIISVFHEGIDMTLQHVSSLTNVWLTGGESPIQKLSVLTVHFLLLWIIWVLFQYFRLNNPGSHSQMTLN